jgi:amino acid adenylation domain-containing protein
VLAVAGVRQGEIVGLYAERSFELVAAMIGILRAGAAYLPLDPAYPAERLAYMLSDSGAVVVATQRRLLDRLPAHEAGVRFVTADDAAAEESTAETATAGKAATEAPAYVLYTSGSTGRPKGAVIPHRAVVNLLADLGPRFGLTARDVVLAQTPPSFDISVIELLLPLTLGARIHLIDRATAVDGTALAAEIDRTGATFVQGTPTTLRMLLASDWGGGDHITLLSGGEALPADVAAGLLRRCGRLWNGYGPTETAVYSLLARIRPDEPIGIGTPLGGERAYVLDGDGNQVPIGVPGELHIGGDGLAHGYLGRPDLTAARFQPDPFDARPGRRMYQTGDLVRWREDGTMEFLGRLDHQVKVRGYRIELEEIESTLRGHASVRDAVVTVTGRDRALQAYLVLRPGTEPGRDDLHRHLARTLPDFMVPATFIAIDGLPVTPSGKVDRHAVAGLGGGRTLTATESAAPESTVEQVLAGVWLDLLETDDLSVTESVFAAGADSLLAMRAAQILHDVFRVPVPVRALFEHPSVRRQAAYLQTRSNRAATIANRLLDLAATASPSP